MNIKNLIIAIFLFWSYADSDDVNSKVRYTKDGKKVVIQKSTFKVFINDSTSILFKDIKIKGRKISGSNKTIGKHKFKLRRREEIYLNKGEDSFVVNSGSRDKSGLMLREKSINVNLDIWGKFESGLTLKSGTGINAGIDFYLKSYHIGILQQIINNNKRKYGLVLSAHYSHPFGKWKGELHRFIETSVCNSFIINSKSFSNFNLTYSYNKEYDKAITYEDGTEYHSFIENSDHIIGIDIGFENQPLKRLAIFSNINIECKIMGQDTVFTNSWFDNGGDLKILKDEKNYKIKYHNFKLLSGVKFLLPYFQLDVGCSLLGASTRFGSHVDVPIEPFLRLHYQYISNAERKRNK